MAEQDKKNCCEDSNCHEISDEFINSLGELSAQILGHNIICDKRKVHLFLHLAHLFCVVSAGLKSDVKTSKQIAALHNCVPALVPIEIIGAVENLVRKHLAKNNSATTT